MVKLIGFVLICVAVGFGVSSALQGFMISAQAEALNKPVSANIVLLK